MSIGDAYLQTSRRWFTYYKTLAERSFNQLEDKDFYYVPNEESNSIAVIIQHMSGNMISRWTNFLSEDGEKTWRKRDEEFEPGNLSKKQLLELWDKGWDCFFDALDALSENDLMKTIHIRSEAISHLGKFPDHV